MDHTSIDTLVREYEQRRTRKKVIFGLNLCKTKEQAPWHMRPTGDYVLFQTVLGPRHEDRFVCPPEYEDTYICEYKVHECLVEKILSGFPELVLPCPTERPKYLSALNEFFPNVISKIIVSFLMNKHRYDIYRKCHCKGDHVCKLKPFDGFSKTRWSLVKPFS